MKRSLTTKFQLPSDQFHFHRSFLAGATGGLCYWTLTYPLDVIKVLVAVYRYFSSFDFFFSFIVGDNAVKRNSSFHELVVHHEEYLP
jgi:hypothetical protein